MLKAWTPLASLSAMTNDFLGGSGKILKPL